MQDIILISIPETTIKNIVKEAIKEALDSGSFTENKAKSTTIFTVEELIQYLKISKGQLYKLTSGNKIPYSKKGKRLYFSKVEIDKWLLSNPSKTANDIQKEADDYLRNNGGK